jgi:hypothetical protein
VCVCVCVSRIDVTRRVVFSVRKSPVRYVKYYVSPTINIRTAVASSAVIYYTGVCTLFAVITSVSQISGVGSLETVKRESNREQGVTGKFGIAPVEVWGKKKNQK